MKHTLPELPYAYDSLEPFIDAQTMELHHAKHHATYVQKLNEALEKHPELADKPLEELLKNPNDVPEDIRTAVRNHGGGHWNHSFFWNCMAPQDKKGGAPPMGDIAEKINAAFGSYEKFKEQFTAAALGVFGSGWAWLIENEGELKIITTPNQDTPFTNSQYPITNIQPLISLDCWEHAYYLKHQNRRADYINAWWNIISWQNK